MRMLAFLAVMMAWGCEPLDPCEDGGMVSSPGGLAVTESEHGPGWANPDCAACHSLPSTHEWICTEDIDAEALREVVEAEGYEGCPGCHGDNGVSE